MALQKLSALLIGLLVSSHALAEEGGQASITVQFSGLEFGQGTSKTKAGDADEEKETTTRVSSFSAPSSLLWITLDKFNIYVYPFDDSNLLGSLSYMVTDSFEVGGTLGLGSEKAKEAETESSGQYISPFVTYYGSLGSIGMEHGFSIGLESLKENLPNASDPTIMDSSTSSTTDIYYSATFVFTLAKNLWVTSGFNFAMSNGEAKTKAGGAAEVKTKASAQEFGINVLGVRMAL